MFDIGAVKEDGKVLVKYTIPRDGRLYEYHTDEHGARMLQRAIEHGKVLKQVEIRKALGVIL